MSALEKAFLKAQKTMEHVVKEAVNPFFRSKYATYDSLVAAVKKPLNDSGLSFRHSSRFADGLYFVGSYLVYGETGEKTESFEVPVKVGNAQETGSALSYARRYSLGALCGIAASDDDDGNAASAKPRTETAHRPNPPETNIYKATNPQKKELMKLSLELGLEHTDELRLISDFCLETPMDKLKDKIKEYATKEKK